MNILHLSSTHVSGAPGNLSDAINNYTEHESDWLQFHHFDDYDYGMMYLNKADVIHWHNGFCSPLYKHSKNKKHVITFHSPPNNEDVLHALQNIPKCIVKTVVGQYHACLGMFKNMQVVRNVVDVSKYKDLQPDQSYVPGLCNFIMTPTPTQEATIWQRKGETMMKLVFESLVIDYGWRNKISYRELSRVPFEYALAAKKGADVVMDECITPSYHLSGIEGLALGKPTFCWLDNRVEGMLKQVSGSDTNPFLGDYVGWLPDIIDDMLKQGRSHLNTLGKNSKKWFDKYWKPQDIVNNFLEIYNS